MGRQKQNRERSDRVYVARTNWSGSTKAEPGAQRPGKHRENELKWVNKSEPGAQRPGIRRENELEWVNKKQNRERSDRVNIARTN